jgi:hypothetical protein
MVRLVDWLSCGAVMVAGIVVCKVAKSHRRCERHCAWTHVEKAFREGNDRRSSGKTFDQH